jgi:hypothetical protein
MGMEADHADGSSDMRKGWHPLYTFFSANILTIKEGMAMLEERGYFEDVGLPEQEEPYKLRQIPMEVIESILMDFDAAWAMPSDLSREFIYHDEDPMPAWRATLDDDDPRKNPQTFRRNQHYQNDEPEDANQRFQHRRTR